MIRKKRQNFGLSSYLQTIPFIDRTEEAEYTFQVYNFPKVFYLGKNSFTISGNSEYLANESEIVIDIEDKDGLPIYYEITNIINKDRTRTVSVYIYPESTIGYCTVYIGGTLKKNFLSGQEIKSDSINVIWQSRVLVTTSDIVKSPPVFAIPPVIRFEEKRVVKKSVDGNRKTLRPNRFTGRISGKSILSPNNLEPNYLDRDIDLDVTTFYPMLSIEGKKGVTEGPIRIPQQSYTVLRSTNFEFSSSMEGGMILIKDVTASNVPTNTLDTFIPPAYSASILRVLNESTIEVFPAWTYQKEYTDNNGNTQTKLFDTFVNSRDFTASFLSSENFRSSYSESYIRLEYSNINPEVGFIDAMRVSLKDVASFGSKIDLGTFKIQNQNLLFNPEEIYFDKTGFIERPIGISLPSDPLPTVYWSASSVNSPAPVVAHDDIYVIDGYKITNSITSSDAYVKVEPGRSLYYPKCYKNSDYDFSFLCSPIPQTGSVPQMDVYVSGSEIATNEYEALKNKRKDDQASALSPVNGIDGHYLGSIRFNSKQPIEMSYKFKTLSEGYLKPFFVIRSGNWTFSNVKILPSVEKGYNPTAGVFYIPLKQDIYASEPIIEIEYLNHEGIASNIVSRITGLPITGSDFDRVIATGSAGTGSLPNGSADKDLLVWDSTGSQWLPYTLNKYVDDAAALTAGLKKGNIYVVDKGNDSIPEGLLKVIL